MHLRQSIGTYTSVEGPVDRFCQGCSILSCGRRCGSGWWLGTNRNCVWIVSNADEGESRGAARQSGTWGRTRGWSGDVCDVVLIQMRPVSGEPLELPVGGVRSVHPGEGGGQQAEGFGRVDHHAGGDFDGWIRAEAVPVHQSHRAGSVLDGGVGPDLSNVVFLCHPLNGVPSPPVVCQLLVRPNAGLQSVP